MASRPQVSNEYLMDDDEFADDLRAARAAMSPVEVAAREGLSSEALRRLDRSDVNSYRRCRARGGATSFATTDGYDRGPPPSGDPFHSIVCGLPTGLPVVPKAPGRPVVVGSVILSGIDATATVQGHFVESAVFRPASVGANEVVDSGDARARRVQPIAPVDGGAAARAVGNGAARLVGRQLLPRWPLGAKRGGVGLCGHPVWAGQHARGGLRVGLQPFA